MIHCHSSLTSLMHAKLLSEVTDHHSFEVVDYLVLAVNNVLAVI